MFRDHEGFSVEHLPDATPSKMKYRRQRIRRVRRRSVAVKLDSTHNTEAIVWLQIRS